MRMSCIRMWFPIAFLLVSTAAVANSDPSSGWTLLEDSDGIQVFKKEIPGSDVIAFQGKTTIEASAEKLWWVLEDAKHEHEWVDRLAVNVVLEQSSPFERVQYQSFDLPWPISDRDFVYRATCSQPEKGVFHILLNSVEHSKSPRSTGVRGDIIESSIILEKKGEDLTHVTVEILSDPKGLIPVWLVNLLQESWPRETLIGMRNQIKKPFVSELALPDIPEPSPAQESNTP